MAINQMLPPDRLIDACKRHDRDRSHTRRRTFPFLRKESSYTTSRLVSFATTRWNLPSPLTWHMESLPPGDRLQGSRYRLFSCRRQASLFLRCVPCRNSNSHLVFIASGGRSLAPVNMSQLNWDLTGQSSELPRF